MDGKTRFPSEVKVRVRGFRKYKGYSDLIETYCCSPTPCYYVIFPQIGYEGYFNKYDVDVREKRGDSKCTKKSKSSL